MFAKERDIEVVRHDISTPKIKNGTSFRIAIVTDLHSFMYEGEQDKLVRLVLEQSPDIVALTGDIVDDKVPPHGAFAFVKKMAKAAPTYYVTGNHEYRRGDVPSIKESFEKLGVKVLSNEYVYLKLPSCEFILAGADDEDGYKSRERWLSVMEGSFSPVSKEKGYKILLLHKPHLAECFSRYGFDLVLSGHTHGGQVRTPFFGRGIFASGQGLFPKIWEGRYDIESFTLIVSRGVAIQPHLPRLFNPPEITVVNVKGCD